MEGNRSGEVRWREEGRDECYRGERQAENGICLNVSFLSSGFKDACFTLECGDSGLWGNVGGSFHIQHCRLQGSRSAGKVVGEAA